MLITTEIHLIRIEILKESLKKELNLKNCKKSSEYEKLFMENLELFTVLSKFLPENETFFVIFSLFKSNLIKKIEKPDLYLIRKIDNVKKIQKLFNNKITKKIEHFQTIIRSDLDLKQIAEEISNRIPEITVKYLIKISPNELVEEIIQSIKNIYIVLESTHKIERVIEKIEILKELSEFIIPKEPYISYKILKDYLIKKNTV